MKKILYFLLVIISVFFIYYFYDKGKINYVTLGDSLMGDNNYGYNDYIENYLIKNNRLNSFNNYYNNSVIGLYRDIKNNRTIRINEQDYFLKKVLRESDYVVISVGQFTFNKTSFAEMYDDIKKLVFEIKKYVYGTTIFLGYYNPNSVYDSDVDASFYNMDYQLHNLMMNNDIIYIPLYELVKNNHFKEENSGFLNSSGHARIAEIIEYYLE